MTRAWAPNLADHDIAEIASILDGWAGKLSWELLIQAIQKRQTPPIRAKLCTNMSVSGMLSRSASSAPKHAHVEFLQLD
jgi:hypothetical protein